MAVTLLDAVLLQKFTLIFSIVFIIACIYGVLNITGFLGKSKGIQAIISVIAGLFVLVVPSVALLIAFIIPWFTFIFIFIIFLLVTYKLFGASDADIKAYLIGDKTIGWLVFIVFLIVLFAGLGQVYGQSLLSGSAIQPSITTEGKFATTSGNFTPGQTATPDYSQNLAATLFHPKMLGMGFILLVAVLTIAILAKDPS